MRVWLGIRHLGRMVAATVAVSTVGLGLASAPVAAAAGVSVAPSTASPGGAVVISGSIPTMGAGSCPTGDGATIISLAALFPPDGFGPQVPRDASGAFRVTYTVPSSTRAGSYTVGVRCGGANVGVGATLNVITGAPGAGLGGASRAGNPLPWMAGGLAAAGVGFALVLARRRSCQKR